MRIIVLISILFSSNGNTSFIKFNPRELIGDGELVKDAANIVAHIGLNCATDPKFIPVFIKEFWRIAAGVARVAAESVQMMLYKKDYPNLCHVMTQDHLNSYSEGKHVQKEKKCSLKGPTGGCLVRKYITKERPQPSYYWPLYFIEVTEKGNDPHEKFAEKNLLYAVNRKIAKALEKFIDQAGAVKLTSIVMGGSNALSSVGMSVDQRDLSEVGSITALTPFEKMRVRASKKDDMRSFDVSIWPVAMGELVARHFSVCGPIREQRGERPGGYSWKIKGVPMTCPVAMVNDSYAFWDTGMLDYLDPEALSAMAIGSNPLSCGMAQGQNSLSSFDYKKNDHPGDRTTVDKKISSIGGLLSESLSSCSFPILGEAHGIAKQALSISDSNKWKQAKCTLWGSTAPRMSTSIYENDYSYANTALKFKMLSHDLFSVPRGKEERWSLAYPWEGGENFLPKKYKSYFNSLGKKLKEFGINFPLSSKGRSFSLLSPGSASLVDMSFTPKYTSDVTANWAREVSYISALSASSIKARREIEKRFSNTHTQSQPLKKEIIWKKVNECSWRDGKRIVKNQEECIALGIKYFGYWNFNYQEKMISSGFKMTRNPLIKEFKTECTSQRKHRPRRCALRGTFCFFEFKSCLSKLKRQYRPSKIDKTLIPNESPESITKRTDTQKILENAAAAAPWVASEVARNSLSEMTGYNPIKGDRRIYTIWEKIDCIYPSVRRTTQIGVAPKFRKYDSCESAIRYEVYKYIQTKFLRKICNAFGAHQGKPWK